MAILDDHGSTYGRLSIDLRLYDKNIVTCSLQRKGSGKALNEILCERDRVTKTHRDSPAILAPTTTILRVTLGLDDAIVGKGEWVMSGCCGWEAEKSAAGFWNSCQKLHMDTLLYRNPSPPMAGITERAHRAKALMATGMYTS